MRSRLSHGRSSRDAGLLTTAASASIVVVMLILGLAPGVIAQDADVDAQPVSDRRDLHLDMPSRLGGYETEVVMTRGQEHFASLDPDRPEDARTREQLERLVEAAGADIEDLVSGYALVSQDDLFGFVVGLRISGAATGTMAPVYLPTLYDDLVDPALRADLIGGKEVVVVKSVGTDDEFVELYVYDEGDTMWFVQGPEDVVEATLADLPVPR